MNHLQRRHLPATESNAIVDLLTARQHSHPHESVAATMERATSQLGCCPAAIARAVEWLKMDVNRAVGRLRRSELLQLARSVYRFWRHTTPSAAKPETTSPPMPTAINDATAPARR